MGYVALGTFRYHYVAGVTDGYVACWVIYVECVQHPTPTFGKRHNAS